MDETGIKLLNLMFRPGERVCVSHNKYGYYSIPLESAFKDVVTLVPTDDASGMARPTEFVNGDELVLVALNPMKEGWRQDENCSAFRSFLVEIDGHEATTEALKAQIDYIHARKMPYSAIIFSGNKSMHFLITLDRDLPSEKVYRIFSEWILSICTMADQKTKNPSRSVRIPGGKRKEGRQRLVKFNGPVKVDDLAAWLNTHPECQPKEPEKRIRHTNPDFNGVNEWAIDLVLNGLDPQRGRNQQWYAIAYEFALSGHDEDDTIALLGTYFNPEKDFKEREWLRTIRSAFEHVYQER